MKASLIYAAIALALLQASPCSAAIDNHLETLQARILTVTTVNCTQIIASDGKVNLSCGAGYSSLTVPNNYAMTFVGLELPNKAHLIIPIHQFFGLMREGGPWTMLAKPYNHFWWMAGVKDPSPPTKNFSQLIPFTLELLLEQSKALDLPIAIVEDQGYQDKVLADERSARYGGIQQYWGHQIHELKVMGFSFKQGVRWIEPHSTVERYSSYDHPDVPANFFH